MCFFFYCIVPMRGESRSGGAAPLTTQFVGISSSIADCYQPFNCYFVARVWLDIYTEQVQFHKRCIDIIEFSTKFAPKRESKRRKRNCTIYL